MARRIERMRVFAGAVLLGVAAAAGCSDGDVATNRPPADQLGQPPDQSSNGLISVDESLIVGRVEGDGLTIEFPVTCLAKAASGVLDVSIREVDGKTTLEKRSVSYRVDALGTQSVAASFALPKDLARQADWVRSSVLIEDGGSLRVTRSLLYAVVPYQLKLDGPSTVRKGKPTTYRVLAENPFTLEPIAGAPVTLSIKRGDERIETHSATTGPAGDAVFELVLPEVGDFTVLTETSRDRTTAALDGSLSVNEPGRKVLLTTDKPLYQPGQIVYLRTVALAPPENTPLANEKVLFEIEDGKGNKIHKRETVTDEHGIAAGRFQIGRVVNMGTFKVRASVGSSKTEKTIDVSRYALPKFRVGVDVDRAFYEPGAAVKGTLDAAYFFGKPVGTADVTLEALALDVAETVFAKVVGKTDADGKMSFSLELPKTLVGLPLDQGNALVTLRAVVTDAAGQAVTKERALPVAAQPARISLIPEATVLVPGVENRLHLFVTDPLGAPVPTASVAVQVDGTTSTVMTDAVGYATIAFTPRTGSATASFRVTVAIDGKTVVQSFDLAAQSGSDHVLVRTDRSVYELGQSVEVEVIASKKEARAYVDWLNEGQAVDMRTLELSDGKGRFTMALDTTLLGSSRIEAYVVDDDGNVARSGRTIFTRRSSALDVALTTDKPVYGPGEPAKLTFSVTDEAGKPAVAALGVQVVDEAVYALVDARPGLLRSFFELEDAYAEPHYELTAPPFSLADMLFDDTRSADPAQAAAAQTRSAAALAALGAPSITGLHVRSWPAVVTEARSILAPYYEAEKPRLIALVKPMVTKTVNQLAREGCTAAQYYCSKLSTTFGQALSDRLSKAIEAYDFWGSRYANEVGTYSPGIKLRTRGPDERETTDDDEVIVLGFSDLGLPPSLGFPTAGGGGAGGTGFGGAAGAAGNGGLSGGAGTGGASGSGGGGEASGPRVRDQFPETLYVNPAVITGADGKATIDVDMADSITEWRVSALAHSASGKLGGGTSGVKVFQDFFVDVDFPATLTRGDEVTFPIAVYNYLPTAQEVQIEIEPMPWYTALGSTKQTISLSPNQVVGVAFPVRVESVGLQTLTVKGIGAKKSDAVARKVLVVPDGKAFPTALSGSVAAGNASLAVSFPANAVAGSPDLKLEVYPAFLSQVVSGMDSMLQVPSGCFEQTTSTAWPNVLVTEYMKQTRQITPEIELKAESLMSAGYQRLLTFEHPGGGFSWFGTQDPAPYLSVTAFGLMEFSDMARVHAVDQAMIERTRNWLLAQQQADGSWKGDQSEFFSFHTSVVRNTAFVVWALAASGYSGAELLRGLTFVTSKLGTEASDGYTLGIVANAFAAAAPTDPQTTALLAELESKKQTQDNLVFWDSAGTQTQFYAGGDDAKVTATALVAHAFLTAGAYKSSVDGALGYLTHSKDPLGNFGSTQATIWALRTLLLAAKKGTDGAVGTLEVAVDGTRFTTLNLTADQSDVMTTVDLGQYARSGSHQVGLSFVGTGKVSYNLVGTHHLPWALAPQEPPGPLSVSVGYDRTALAVNETVKATVRVVNNTASEQSMVLVTLGIPPGFAVLTEDLDVYKANAQLSHYELTGKQLTLYLTSLQPSATASFEYRLRATMPVRASDGGATAYLYYEPKQRAAAAATKLEARAQ